MKVPKNLSNKTLLKICNINLDRIKGNSYNNVTNKFYKMLTITDSDELHELIKDEEFAETYERKIKSLSTDKSYWKGEEKMDETLEMEFKIKDAYEGGITLGEFQGENRKLKKMVLNMFKCNLPITTIAECSELSVEEVEKILKRKKK